mgnify:CR=1 FL=1
MGEQNAPQILIEARGISKSFAGVEVLRDVDLALHRGEIHALLGENGAGKSTLMRTVATLQDADSGSVFLGDVDVLSRKQEVRRLLGYLQCRLQCRLHGC